MTSVRPVALDDVAACDAIVAAPPYFFGDPVGVRNAAADIRKNPGWVPEDNGHVTGFLSLAWSTPEVAEISWMAVHPDHRRGGRGRALVNEAMDYTRGRGARMLMLFTSARRDPSGVQDGFEGTRHFYAALGFVALWVVKPEGWRAEHLLMVKPL